MLYRENKENQKNKKTPQRFEVFNSGVSSKLNSRLYNNKAFTLIELLVVIAIIGVLSTLVIVALGNSRAKAKDSQRINHIRAIGTALDLYYANNNAYPATITPGQPIADLTTTYMAKVPSNPTPWNTGGCPNKDYQYSYVSNSYALTYCLTDPVGSVGITGGPVTHTPDGTTLPLVYYTFEEGAGTSTTDKSGNDYNGTLVNGPSWTTRPNGGNALDFGGASDYVSIPASMMSNVDNSITFAAWIYADGSAGVRSLISDGAQSQPTGYLWAYLNVGTVVLQYRHSSGNGSDWGVPSFLTGFTNTWVHIAIVADYNSKRLSVYRNGDLFGTSIATNDPIFPAVSRVRYLGAYNSGGSSGYNGLLDDARLYNRALSASEIKALYDATN